jgi:hypothetical protein
MWHVPHSALPLQLWVSISSAARIAESSVVPSATSIVLPDGMIVKIDIEPPNL